MNEYRDKFKYTKKLKLFDDLVEAGLHAEDSYYNVIRVNMFYVFQYHDEKGQIADWRLNQSTDLITDSIKRVIKHLEPSLQNIVINNLALHFKNLSMAKAIDQKRKDRIGLLSRDIYKLILEKVTDLDNNVNASYKPIERTNKFIIPIVVADYFQHKAGLVDIEFSKNGIKDHCEKYHRDLKPGSYHNIVISWNSNRYCDAERKHLTSAMNALPKDNPAKELIMEHLKQI